MQQGNFLPTKLTSYSHHLVARRPLPKGTDIIVEYPFAFVPFIESGDLEPLCPLSSQERLLLSSGLANSTSLILAARVHSKISEGCQQRDFMSLCSSTSTNRISSSSRSSSDGRESMVQQRSSAFRALLGPVVKHLVVDEDGLFGRLDSNVFTIQDPEMCPIGNIFMGLRTHIYTLYVCSWLYSLFLMQIP